MARVCCASKAIDGKPRTPQIRGTMPTTASAQLNPDLIDTGTPPIPEAQGWARAYGGARGPLIDLSQAVPGAPPPVTLLEKLAAAAAEPGSTRYGGITGDAALREAYAAEISRIYGTAFAPAEVAITSGCNQAYVVTMMALARAGDNVLLPTPWYFNHEMTLTMLGVEARPLPCAPEAGFVPDVTAEALIDDRTRAIVLVTPNNPTGAVYPPETIAAFAALCARRGIWLVLDETYRDFLPADVAKPHEVFATTSWQDSVIGLYSFSKAYAMTGYRVGSITASAKVLAEVEKIIDCMSICPAHISQRAALFALESLEMWKREKIAMMHGRLDAFRAAFRRRGLAYELVSSGALFAYVKHPFTEQTGKQVAMRLAGEHDLLCLPGSMFGPGQESYLRIAFARAEPEDMETLVDRLIESQG